MPDQIYEIEVLKKKCLEALRRTGGHMSTGMVVMAVGAQYHAVEAVLESAFLAREVTFSAGIGWLAGPETPARPAPSSDAQTDLVGG